MRKINKSQYIATIDVFAIITTFNKFLHFKARNHKAQPLQSGKKSAVQNETFNKEKLKTVIKKSFHIAIYTLILICFTSCASDKLSSTRRTKTRKNIVFQAFPEYDLLNKKDQQIADSIISYALDHEALFSLIGDLKPISSIGFSLSFPLVKEDDKNSNSSNTNKPEQQDSQQYVKEIVQWNRILNALSFGDYKFILLPFKHVWNENRQMQILICRKDLIDELIEKKSSFFNQWGFVPGFDPSIILTAVEFENPNNRYRAYGYLFGYPDDSVNFFVNASINYQKNKKFIERDFFNIPVFTQEKGYFTYAKPKGSKPNEDDLLILKEASIVLEEYKSIRSNFINEEGRLLGVELFRAWWRQKLNQQYSQTKEGSKTY